jgi:hypothetical protein
VEKCIHLVRRLRTFNWGKCNSLSVYYASPRVISIYNLLLVTQTFTYLLLNQLIFSYALSGTNSTSSKRSHLPHPRRIHSLAHRQVINVSAGRFHSLAVTKCGRVYSWGHGRGGRLGHGDEEVRMIPTVCVWGGGGAFTYTKLSHVCSVF